MLGGDLEQCAGRVAVGAHEVIEIARDDQSGHVEDHIGAGAASGERLPVAHVAADRADATPAEGLGFGGRAHQARHRDAVREQLLNEVCAYEPGAAGDERLHTGRS